MVNYNLSLELKKSELENEVLKRKNFLMEIYTRYHLNVSDRIDADGIVTDAAGNEKLTNKEKNEYKEIGGDAASTIASQPAAFDGDTLKDNE